MVSGKKKYGSTFLTERQFQILSLQKEGKSLAEIASLLSVSIQNVSQLHGKIVKCVERCRKTISLYNSINNGIQIEIGKGSNILDCVRKVFQAADQSGIKLKESYLSLAELLRDTERIGIKRGTITTDITVGIKADGTVVVKKVGDPTGPGRS